MPGKVLPDSEVDQLVRQGKTDREIAEYLAAHLDIFVTQNAITAWRRRRGDEPRRPRHSDLLPWTVKREHTFAYIPKLLRWEARLRAGEQLDPRNVKRLETFKEKLATAFPQGGVVHYDRDTEQGWFVVERRPGIDTDMIRTPEVP